MKLADFRFLADENIHPGVVTMLRARGFDVATVVERGWTGSADSAILQAAKSEDRVILTHDGDFSRLAVVGRQPIVGIVRLRPGHIEAAFTLATVESLLHVSPELKTPFILVADRRGSDLSIRVRSLGESLGAG